VESVPEPATWAMLLAGLGGLGAVMHSRAGWQPTRDERLMTETVDRDRRPKGAQYVRNHSKNACRGHGPGVRLRGPVRPVGPCWVRHLVVITATMTVATRGSTNRRCRRVGLRRFPSSQPVSSTISPAFSRTNLMYGPLVPPRRPYWEIRSGVSSGNGGTLIGQRWTVPTPLTATGRSDNSALRLTNTRTRST